MNKTEDLFGFRMKWLGCACFEIDFGGLTVVNDPWITTNARTELTWEAVEKCDYITLTHGHYDHTLDIPALVKKFDPYLLCGENTALPLMRWADLNPMRVFPMYPGTELDLDAVKIKAVWGRHTPLPGTVNERAEKWASHSRLGGDKNLIEMNIWGDIEYRNYLFTTPNGTKLLLWGNRMEDPDQRNTMRQIRPDIAVMQTTTPSSPVDIAQICAEIGCRVVIPNHIDFPTDKTPLVRKLGEELAERAPQIRYIVPEYGRWISL